VHANMAAKLLATAGRLAKRPAAWKPNIALAQSCLPGISNLASHARYMQRGNECVFFQL